MDRHVIHLLNRAGFGPSPQDIKIFAHQSRNKVVDALFESSSDVEDLQVIDQVRVPIQIDLRKLDFKARRKMKRRLKAGKQSLNYRWLLQMAHGKAQLREKISFFWHDHFACNIGHSRLIEKQINTIRRHALGYFGDLVVALSKDPAMIEYLNSKQNVKAHPNENFGRELLELFTIGIGNYSEFDIKEAARAFTGWRYDEEGNFFVDKDKHDEGQKQFMGRHGNFSGEDIIDIILENQKTGNYITEKIYYFLTGELIGEAVLEDLSSKFYASGYHIGTLIENILKSDHFYSEHIIGQKIKSPVEFIAGLLRITQARPARGSFTFLAQERLRQKLLSPPNVSGWIADKEWIDMSTLADRLNLASKLLQPEISVSAKSNPLSDEGDGLVLKKADRLVRIKTNLIPLKQVSRAKNRKHQIHHLAKMLYTVNMVHLHPLLDELTEKYVKKEILFKDALNQLLSLPEYQLH